MAQGIEWYRAHHGTVTDPKFAVVAKRSGQRRGDVIAVWHLLMEDASAAADRGNPGAPDFETIDDLLGMDEGAAAAIYEAMTSKGLIVRETGRLEAWDRRQPKRERDDATAADRKRAQRGRDAAADTESRTTESAEGVTDDGCASHATSRQVTPSTCDVTPREEERREEGIPGAKAPSSPPSPAPTRLTCPHSRIQSLYNEILPELPEAKTWAADRERAARQRWSEIAEVKGWTGQDEGVAWFRRFFEAVRADDFLMGRTAPGKGHEGWRCTIDHLLTPKGFRAVFEGHRRTETAT
jgi:hypothetical protein